MGYLEHFEETQHGHRKRLFFFLDCLNNYCREHETTASEVSILDIGCGNGEQVTLPIGEAGYQVTGIDWHEPSIEWAQRHNTLKGVRFLVGDVNVDLPPDHQFDVAILSDILEHVHDPANLLLAAQVRLKPGGMLLLSIPNGYGWFELESLLIRIGLLKPLVWLTVRIGAAVRRNKEIPPFNYESGHVQWFTRKRFVNLLRDSGFEVTRFRKGAVSGGNLSGMVVGRFPPLLRLGVAAADYLPAFMSSVWHWEAHLRSDAS